MGELEPMKMQLIMIATLVAASAYAHDFKSCGTDNLAVASVDVSPDNPIPGANLTVTFTGTPTQDVIVGDTLTITVKVFGVALGHVDFDFCKDLGVTCPIKAGTVSKWNAVYLVPKAAPAGVPLTAEFTAKSSAGAQYSCVDVAVTMGKPPSATPVFLVEAIAAPSCYHHNDVDHNKCYEACGEGSFVVPKLEAKGACGDEYTETDSSSNVNQCSDGVTNVKYCKGGDKRVVALTVKTKGMVGACFHAIQSNKCSEACATSMFKMTGVTDAGPCPSLYKVIEKTQFVESCSDGVTNTKYCTKPLYVVNVTMKIKGESGPVLAMSESIDMAVYEKAAAAPSSWTCVHREDAVDHKCYEACAQDTDYKVKGLDSAGACSSKYSTDSTKTVKACSDGVTNLKYCTAGGLHAVTLVEKTKGEAGAPKVVTLIPEFIASLALEQTHCKHRQDSVDHKCYQACATNQGGFKVKGLALEGVCPSKYSQTDSTSSVKACSDGVTNIKYCTAGGLRVVDLTETTKGEARIIDMAVYEKVAAAPSSWTCVHREDAVDHKCYEACAQDTDYKVKGLDSAGACSSKYSTDSTKTVKACSDGVTNLKYCTAGGLHAVTLVEKTKGEAGLMAAADQTTLYKISKGECGEATLDSKYASYAEKFAGLAAGTCASQGYTVADGSQTVKVPVLGDITIAKFKKASVVAFSD